ncbi:MAG: AsnC family transcriptional regulator [Sphingomonadales bacterium RIFCSPLOWO2_12_FULL_63_15]|nr:MAG: AsnC family transcriptional regulator [Sphingomonadales bacterium RIFCSPLOWO2_12_FULL_63_15]
MLGGPRLDRIDLKILTQLQMSGRITNVELADAVGLSPSPCLTRVKRLEKAGYITGYGAHINLHKLGEYLTVFTEVTLTEHRAGDFSRFETRIRKLDEIVEGMLESDYGIEKYFSYVVIKSPFIKHHYPIQHLFGEQR